MNYPFTKIWINGRFVSLDSILQYEVRPLTPFEDHTFSFIREWLSDQNTFIIQTSGSTGEPKPITVTREQMLASAKLTEQALQLKKFSDSLVCVDTKYIGGKMMLVRSLVIGMRIWAVDPTANPLLKLPVDQCVNFAAFVPLQVQNILGSKHPHLLNNIDTIIIGGAPLDRTTLEQLDSFLCKCYATYGMTETLSHVALRLINGKNKQPYFEILPGIDIQKDERGCLIIEASYLPDKVVTNDLVELTGTRQFVWLGRWDNVINSGGVKVIPEKVEAALEKIFSQAGITNRFFIQGVDDAKLGTKIILVIEASGHMEEVINTALTELKNNLSPYEIPKAISFTPSFITTDTGKINRVKTLEKINLTLDLKK